MHGVLFHVKRNYVLSTGKFTPLTRTPISHTTPPPTIALHPHRLSLFSRDTVYLKQSLRHRSLQPCNVLTSGLQIKVQSTSSDVSLEFPSLPRSFCFQLLIILVSSSSPLSYSHCQFWSNIRELHL
jgi:hypothetical protein